MWWDTWEMWGRGRFRKKRKSKQKAESSKRKFFSYQTDSKYYIMAEPVELNPLFKNPIYAKKVYKSVLQPPTPSPTVEDIENEEYDSSEVEVSRPYRKGRSILHLDSKSAVGLTPLPERSHENTPSPHFSSPGPFTRSSSNYSLPRKQSISISAFLDYDDTSKPSSPDDEAPTRPLPRSPVCSFDALKNPDLEANLPEEEPSESRLEEMPSSAVSSPGPTPDASSAEISPNSSSDSSPSHSHSPCKVAKVNLEAGSAYYAKVDPEAGPSHGRSPAKKSHVSETMSASLDLSDPSIESDIDTSPKPMPPHVPHKLNLEPQWRGRRAPFPYPCADTSPSDDEDLSPVKEHEVHKDFEIINDPYKVCWINNFIKDEQFLEDLVNFVQNGNYTKRDNDMFTYHQMEDETFMSNPLAQRLVTTLVQDVIPFMSKVVGKELTKEKVTISASKYSYTNHLLCHDDLSGDRRIAFVIYLNKRWERTWGGSLDLFNRDYLNDPGLVTLSLIPEFNRFLFFEVSAFSFHQVSEVLAKNESRYTINGWFHYPKPIMQRGIYEPGLCQIRPGYVNMTEEEWTNFMHPRWLRSKYFKDKRDTFQQTRHVYLIGFFEMGMYSKILDALNKCQEFVEIGPPNRRRYEIIPETRLDGFLKDICRVLISEWMFKFVWQYTGRKLHPVAFEEELKAPGAPPHPSVQFIGQLPLQESGGGKSTSEIRSNYPDPRCSILIRRWRKGFYTTALDDENEVIASKGGRIVDAVITLGHTTETPVEEGGATIYIDRATGKEDYRYHPCGRNNTLHLSELSIDYYRYTKYINDKSNGVFYDFVLIFKE